MNSVALIVVLAFGWIAITGGFTIDNLVLGAAVAALVVYLMRHRSRIRAALAGCGGCCRWCYYLSQSCCSAPSAWRS